MAYFELHRDNQLYYARGENICSLHLHRSVELLYVLHGEKTVKLGNHTYILRANDLLICPPYQPHLYMPSERSEQVVATVFTEFCPHFELLCKTATPKTHVYHDANNEILPLVLKLQTKTNDVLFSGIINQILGIFVQNTPFIENEMQKEQELAAQIVEFINEHYTEPLTLSSLAKKFGYSPNYFSQLFNQYLGLGLSPYINGVRIQKSLDFLNEKNVEETAYACGFNSPQQYYLNFKKIHNCSPKEYFKKQ